MSLEISTAGIKISHATETTAGTRPTASSAYTALNNIYAIGEMNPEPATYDVTDLSDTVWKRYIAALKDMGGAIALSAHLNNDFISTWNTLCASAATARATGKKTWFCVEIPDVTNAFYIAGMPSELGLPAIDTDAVFEGDVYIAPEEIAGWAAKPTT